MKICKTFSTWATLATGVTLCVANVITTITDVAADTNQTPSLSFGTTVDPALNITVGDGSNLYGRRTIFSGSGVDFGKVTFTNPSLVGNGDAYVASNRLWLEAILDISISFSGLTAATVELSKSAGSANPFSVALFSMSKNRSELAVEILTEPRGNQLTTINAPTTFPVRLVFGVSPQQSGNIGDRLRIVATSQ